METNILAIGSLVYVTCYGPFRGLKGVVRAVDIMVPPDEEGSLCFYLVALHEGLVKEPLWLIPDDIAAVEGESVGRRYPGGEKKLSRAEAEAFEIIVSGFEQERRKEPGDMLTT